MNDDQLDDLKQFIDSRISQSEVRFDTKLDTVWEEFSEKIDTARQEVADGFAGVGDALEETNKQVDGRLTRLEQQAA